MCCLETGHAGSSQNDGLWNSAFSFRRLSVCGDEGAIGFISELRQNSVLVSSAIQTKPYKLHIRLDDLLVRRAHRSVGVGVTL